MAENIIGFVIFLFVAIVMLAIGISQIRSKDPVGFYTGERPPKKEQLTDVEMWNKKHGILWISYGIVILVSFLSGMLVKDEIIFTVIVLVGILGPLPVMMWRHSCLKKKFLKPKFLKPMEKEEAFNSVRVRYLELFEKDVKLQELYPQSYQQLQKELSEEEWSVLKPVIDNHLKTERHKSKLMERFESDETLQSSYGDICAQLSNAASDEELEKYEEILRDYENRKGMCNRWLAYLKSFPKLKEKYAREYELLHRDLSAEEIAAVAVILSYELVLLESLKDQYDAYVSEKTEQNYAVGKVEKLYKGYIGNEELMRKYPEETEALLKYYGPEFDEFFFESNGTPKYADVSALHSARSDLHFKDILFFRKFIERNNVLGQYVITDREYTAINNKLRTYVPLGAIRDIAGTYTGYSLSYENFLRVKELYPEEVAFYASQETGDEDTMRFINKMCPYLTQREIQYKV